MATPSVPQQGGGGGSGVSAGGSLQSRARLGRPRDRGLMAVPLPSIFPQQQVASFHTASLYVGDLAPDIPENVLFEIFNQVGPVASIRVCRDTVTRRSLGYAYVNFHNAADAERALDTMNFTLIKNKPCRIMWSQRDPSLRRSGVGNIFVKNLDTSVDNKALYDTFSLFGNILSCKVATDERAESKGYGYVHYETAEAANEAIDKIDGMLIAGKQVHVGHFVRRNERAGQSDWTNVYIKNIPLEWSEEELKKRFSEFGEVTSLKIEMGIPAPTPKPTPAAEGEEEPAAAAEEEPAVPKSKGFGFVNFAEHEAAQACVAEMNGKVFGEGEDAKEMFVCRAQKKGERQRELQQKYDQMKLERINKYQGVNLYVKNLDESISEEDVREAFAPFGTITSARIMKDHNTGQNLGFGFVCFSAPEEATKAVQEMNNKMLANKPVYVALAQRKEVRRAQLEAQYSQRMPPRGPMGVQPMGFGMPYMMAGQPGMPQQRAGYPMMPPQMMPRGAPRTPQMPYGGRGAYPMPAAYAMGGAMPGAPQQRRGGRRQAPAGRGMPRTAGGPQGRGGFKYTQQVRNQPGMMPAGMPQQVPMGAPGPGESLSAQALAAASPEVQKNMIGERLYPLIAEVQPNLAGKITGMLLEMDNGELLHLLESPESLKAKIQEALTVLEEHSTKVEG
jgi:polyadenylate-binding protein